MTVRRFSCRVIVKIDSSAVLYIKAMSASNDRGFMQRGDEADCHRQLFSFIALEHSELPLARCFSLCCAISTRREDLEAKRTGAPFSFSAHATGPLLKNTRPT